MLVSSLKQIYNNNKKKFKIKGQEIQIFGRLSELCSINHKHYRIYKESSKIVLFIFGNII